jgi:exodeoxyribonuclease VII large subunit
VEAIKLANRYSAQSEKPLDVLIVGRGGGSYEDLFCFNDEAVARAIVGSKIPVVSAVGHQIDFTIADMVADLRAATPSDAAQLTTPDREDWLKRLREIRAQTHRRMINKLSDYRLKIDTWMSRIVSHSPDKKIQGQKDMLKQFARRFPLLVQIQIDKRKSSLTRLAGLLDALSPLKVMNRGYSLVRDENGKVVTSVNNVSSGQKVAIALKDGNLKALIQ